ncbi:tRNA uridine(34) 5-carboxymethylaminomethyl modification radical SAM/GNAT enzyme Elp3 [Patescibacteria group bacterium]|nr:tRNA uridine(34) 5-carboxymethylaminomethyl modification radical SAM/GNAT enzyme Elp3 [Patescibacteria group bacterium]
MTLLEKQLNTLVKKLVQKRISSLPQFSKLKHQLAGQLKIPPVRNFDILKTYQKLKKKKQVKTNIFLQKQLKKRPIRSLSGVAVVAVLTKPWPCPGKCLYCPLEKGVPKSYLSGEPAVERAKILKYDPYQQVKKRIEVLKNNNHPVDKIELIVIGGTWSYLPKKYQTWFIKRCFDGANPPKFSKKTWAGKTLAEAQKRNEKAKHRIIGITLETRPDYITPKEIIRMRKLGCTRVEIGVQIIDDKVLKINNRGHGVKEIIYATKLLKNAGLKICYHIMPGLLGSNPQKDLKMFKKLFANPDFQPDMLKIYPCVVTKGSQLYGLYKSKKYKPYTDKQLMNLLIKMKSIVPEYVRINRLIRDIPAWQIQGGSKISNLREYVQKQMNPVRNFTNKSMKKKNVMALQKKRISNGVKEQKKICSCIRCREIKNESINIKNLKLKKQKYIASQGQEIFLSFEDVKQNKLAAFLRLRLPQINNQTLPGLENAAIIRELHTYGQLVEIHPVKSRKAGSPTAKFNRVEKTSKKAAQPRKVLINQDNVAQHLGLGKKLMAEAEKIAKEQGYKKIAVISGVGVRDYYRHLGYRLQNTYLVKSLKPQ